MATNKISFVGIHNWCDLFYVFSSISREAKQVRQVCGPLSSCQIKFDVEFAVLFVYGDGVRTVES